MVIGLLALAGIPSSIGTITAVSQSHKSQNEQERDEIRGEECHLTIFCSSPSPKRKQVHGTSLMLHQDKVWARALPKKEEYTSKGHPFKGFWIGYPDDTVAPEDQVRGLVSLSSVDPPAMGWLYVDTETLELKYGNRSTSLPHWHGPWDMTEDNDGVTFLGEELFVAVEESKGNWALYYDKHEDGRGLPKGKATLPVSIERKSKEMLDKT